MANEVKRQARSRLGNALGFLAKKRFGLRGIMLAATLLALIGAGCWWWVYVSWIGLPSQSEIRAFSPKLSGTVFTADGEALGEFGEEYRRVIPYEKIPPVVARAILAAEDKAFFSRYHRGIDPFGVLRALLDNLQSGRIVSGGSSITQQLVRLRFFSYEMEREWRGEATKADKWIRKIREMRLALRLEREYEKRYSSRQRAKEKIFEEYAAMVFLGRLPRGGAPQYGMAAGADFFFGKPLDALEVHEAALLAALIRKPIRYSPLAYPELAETRRNMVLERMRDNGYIGEEEFRVALQKPFGLRKERWNPRDLAPAGLGYLFDTLSQNDQNAVYQEGAAVVTTIDSRVQCLAVGALRQGLEEYRRRHAGEPEKQRKATGVAVVLENGSGNILAMTDGSGKGWRDFNLPSQARRQPGSAFKVFTYLAALEEGWELSCGGWTQSRCRVRDAPVMVNMGGGKPPKVIQNYDKKYKGMINFGVAFAESRNAATMWLAGEIGGVENVIAAARRLGLEGRFEPYPTTVLGAGEVTPLELAAAYAAIANGGYRVEPRIAEAIRYRNGQERVFEKSPFTVPVIAEDIEEKILALLRGPVLWHNGTARHTLGALPFPVGAKTGTSSDFRDAWVIAFTYGQRGRTVLVWIGIEDNTPIGDDERKEPGGRVAAPIAKKILEGLYRGREPDPFPEGAEELAKDVFAGVAEKKSSVTVSD